MVLALFCELMLIKIHTNGNYDNILDKLAFQYCRSKIKVTVVYGGGITFSDCLVFFTPIL